MKGCLQLNRSMIYVVHFIPALAKICTWWPQQSADNVDRIGGARWKPMQNWEHLFKNREQALVCMETKEYFFLFFMFFKIILLMFNSLRGRAWPPGLVTALFPLGPIQFSHKKAWTKTALTRFLFIHTCTHANVHRYAHGNRNKKWNHVVALFWAILRL